MKSIERHKLKENEFARTVAHARDVLDTRKRDLTIALTVAGRRRRGRRRVRAGGGRPRDARRQRSARLGDRRRTTRRSCRSPRRHRAARAPLPQPGTFTTEQEKLQAALPKFREAADRYPDTGAGLAARYPSGRHPRRAGAVRRGGADVPGRRQQGRQHIYARTARLGLADAQVAQGKYDSAINIYTEAEPRHELADPGGQRADAARSRLRAAGRKEEAARTFDRIVQEFPQSLYVTDAAARARLGQKILNAVRRAPRHTGTALKPRPTRSRT